MQWQHSGVFVWITAPYPTTSSNAAPAITINSDQRMTHRFACAALAIHLKQKLLTSLRYYGPINNIQPPAENIGLSRWPYAAMLIKVKAVFDVITGWWCKLPINSPVWVVKHKVVPFTRFRADVFETALVAIDPDARLSEPPVNVSVFNSLTKSMVLTVSRPLSATLIAFLNAQAISYCVI